MTRTTWTNHASATGATGRANIGTTVPAAHRNAPLARSRIAIRNSVESIVLGGWVESSRPTFLLMVGLARRLTRPTLPHKQHHQERRCQHRDEHPADEPLHHLAVLLHADQRRDVRHRALLRQLGQVLAETARHARLG